MEKTVKIGLNYLLIHFTTEVRKTYCLWTVLGLQIDLKMWLQQDQKLVSPWLLQQEGVVSQAGFPCGVLPTRHK